MTSASRRGTVICMRVLVAYASKRGSTAEIAEAIAAESRDLRNWDEIRAWALHVASELTVQVVT